jgi:nitrite reductase (NADH) large subunit
LNFYLNEDEELLKALAERFKYSQQFAQIDPWAERAKGADRHEFIPLKVVA